MLVDLTPIPSEIERARKIAQESDYPYHSQASEQFICGKGIYRCEFDFNFSTEEFEETCSNSGFDLMRSMRFRGVADTIQQIRKKLKEQIEDASRRYFIAVTPVFQDKKNEDSHGEWRWEKWGEYIGNLDPKCEYLDDEEFGEDFEYIIVFEIYELEN